MFVVFLSIGTILPFFYSNGKTPLTTHCLKIIFNGLRIAGTRMLLLSCSCAWSKSKIWIILAISSWEKVTEGKRLLVKYWVFVGRVPPLFIAMFWYCFEKSELKSLASSQKLVTNWFSWNSGGIRMTFLWFKKHFNKDQYGLEFLWRLFNFFLVITTFWFSC